MRSATRTANAPRRLRAALALCLAPLVGACGEGAAPQPSSQRVELVRVERTPHTLMGEEVHATFALVNDGTEPVAFWGGMGERPCYRLAYLSEGEWIEHTPAWVECGTGLDVGVLQPGARAELDVRVARPDLPLRVGAGVWTPVDAHRPPWESWRWSWSATLVLDERTADGD